MILMTVKFSEFILLILRVAFNTLHSVLSKSSFEVKQGFDKITEENSPSFFICKYRAGLLKYHGGIKGDKGDV